MFQDMLDYKSKVRHLKIKFMDGSVKTLQVQYLVFTSCFFFSVKHLACVYQHVVCMHCTKLLHVQQCAMKFLTDGPNPRLVDFPVGLLDSTHHLPNGQVKFFGNVFLRKFK